MKTKSLQTSFATVSMLLAAAAAQAQGTVNFNSVPGGPFLFNNEVTGSTAKIAAGSFAIGLYVGTTTNALLSSTAPVLIVTNIGGGIISLSTYTVPGLLAGSTYIFQVKGWEAASGARSYEDRFLSPFTSGDGVLSQIGEFTMPNFVGGIAPQVFGFTGGSVPTPVLSVPEPSAMALGGLAVASVGSFRRRKRVK